MDIYSRRCVHCNAISFPCVDFGTHWRHYLHCNTASCTRMTEPMLLNPAQAASLPLHIPHLISTETPTIPQARPTDPPNIHNARSRRQRHEKLSSTTSPTKSSRTGPRAKIPLSKITTTAFAWTCKACATTARAKTALQFCLCVQEEGRAQ